MDARTRYTKMMIKNTFLSLLKEKPVGKVSVTEICEGAQINRSTFYKYYDNPQDLLNKLEDEYLKSLSKKLSRIEMRDFNQVFSIVLNDVKDNQDYFQTIVSENGDVKFRDSIFDLIFQSNLATIKHIFPTMSAPHQRWLFYYLAEGFNGIFKQWMNDGMQEDVEELVHFANALVVTINEHFRE